MNLEAPLVTLGRRLLDLGQSQKKHRKPFFMEWHHEVTLDRTGQRGYYSANARSDPV